jgi:hypothetical protein
MESTRNNDVNRELERLLTPLRESSQVHFDIVRALIDEVYQDPTLGSPEKTSREIENKLYRMIDDHIKFTTKQEA